MNQLIAVIILTISVNVMAKDKQEVAIFKNGSAFIVESKSLKIQNGRYFLKDIPPALFGTLWFHSKKSKIDTIKSLEESIDIKQPIKSIDAIIRGNIGKSVIVTVFNNKKPILGTLSSIEGDIVVIKNKNWTTLKLASIEHIDFIDKPELTTTGVQKSKMLEFKFSKKGNKNIDMFYMVNNIGWFPNYLINLKKGNIAKLKLQATLINDSTDLKNADVSFVVGVPNFKYRHLNSPLTSSDQLVNFMNSLNGRSYNYNNFDNYNMSNSIMTQQRISPRSFSSNNRASYSGSSEFSTTDVSSLEDLFFYRHKGVTLNKGERATYTLLEVTTPFEHIYEVKLPQNRENINYYNTKYGYNNRDKKENKVWHSIKLKNKTSVPWTTGTAMVIKSEKGKEDPLSQDTMYYTPVKGETYLKITVAPDIQVDFQDEEIKRTGPVKIRGYNYYKVTVKGVITVKNYKSKKVKLNIKREVLGRILEKSSTQNWKLTKLFKNRYSNNTLNEVVWDINLKSQEEKKIEYKYVIYAN